MRILFLSSSGQLGGAERLLLDLLGALGRAHPDWALHLAAIEPGPFVNDARALGVHAEVLTLPAALAGLGEAGLSPLALARRLGPAAGPLRAFVKQLRAHVAAVSPTLVHSNGLKTHLLSAWALGGATPLVWHLHDYVGSRRVTVRLLRWFASRADLGIANSASVAADAEAALAGRLPLSVVLNAVDVAGFSAGGPALDLDAASGLDPAPAGTVRVGLLGTFARWKGHLAFLDALAALPATSPIRGYIIGGPVYQTAGSQFTMDELTARARQLGLTGRVGFTGFQPDRAGVLRGLDIVVHASTSPEPFGLVIAEAMAAGRPLVTSALGGAAELVRPGIDALTWDAADPLSLARAIDQLAADATGRAALGARAREAAIVKFSPARMTEEVVAAYERAIARHTGTPLEAAGHA
jgi:glycosyltransferase involved in cell wall biosynthesis